MRFFAVITISLSLSASCITQIAGITEAGSEARRFNTFTKVEPPSIFRDRAALGKTSTARFVIRYAPNFPLWDQRDALQYATSIWQDLIHSGVDIMLHVRWDTIRKHDGTVDTTTLARTWADTISVGYCPNALDPNRLYATALAEARCGDDLNGSSLVDSVHDMVITFNRYFENQWYYGTVVHDLTPFVGNKENMEWASQLLEQESNKGLSLFQRGGLYRHNKLSQT